MGFSGKYNQMFVVGSGLLALLAGIMLANGCTRKADEPTPAEQTPLFGTTCLIGTDSVKLYAGVNDYYLTTNYSRDSTGIFVLSGEFKKQNCTACTEDLKIAVYDDTMRTAGGITNISRVLAPGTHSYAANGATVQPSRTIQFTAADTGTAYLWSFGDGTANTANPLHTFIAGGLHTVCLTVTDVFLRKTTVCNGIIVDDNNNCNVQFTAQATGTFVPGSYNFTATAGHQSYIWNFGDASTATSIAPSYTHSYTNTGIYRASVSVHDAGGCNSMFSKDVVVSNQDTLSSGYSYTIQPPVLVGTPNYSKINISWINSKGLKYTSHKPSGQQPAQSFFTITAGAPYKADANGHTTYQITALLKAYLYNTANITDSIIISTNKIKLAVAYP